MSESHDIILNSCKHICQITTMHPRYDVRIFFKICLSLVADYKVSLIVADGLGDEISDGVRIYDIGIRSSSRILGMIRIPWKAYRKALELNCDIVHFHDPEFLYFGLKLTRKGKFVVYDSHEDLPKQILGKHYIKVAFKPLISKIIELFENFVTKRLSAIVTATPKINDRFSKINVRSIYVCNYVRIDDFITDVKYSDRERTICYIGGISRERGIKELVAALSMTDPPVLLELAGKIDDIKLEHQLKSCKNWNLVRYHGYIGRNEIKSILKTTRIGILTLYSTPNHLNSLPIKLFEYLAAGIPVIASDFPLWKEIIEGNNCGICVDPTSPEKIADAVNYLLSNPQTADVMGKNGIIAAEDKFNWSSEMKKLLELYTCFNNK